MIDPASALGVQLAEETERLLAFSVGARHPAGGFAWLDGAGRPLLDRPIETWITCRMTHVLSLGALLGHAEHLALVEHGVEALRNVLHDDQHGGWFAAANRPDDGAKRAYDHAFVLLAASSATVAGARGATTLLYDAIAVHEARFWDESLGRVHDVWSRDWTEQEPYGGANANMHTVEAHLAVADATDDPVWRHRAVRIADFFINRCARTRDWRIPEHFSTEWVELPDFNVDRPADQFRPYGATPGHGFEWSRLLVHLDAALGSDAPAWLIDAACRLFARSVEDGWRDGGFVYTTDWSGTPVVKDRLHWVLCEALAAASVLHRATGEDAYADRVTGWWELARRRFVDREHGSWHHQLDAANHPDDSVWSGKPDTYHAVQATLIPRFPLAPTLAAALRG